MYALSPVARVADRPSFRTFSSAILLALVRSMIQSRGLSPRLDVKDLVPRETAATRSLTPELRVIRFQSVLAVVV